jgi:flavin reductase (DIM6/NTAB) family NADH-FMN oxidoreductase RutF
VNPRVTPTPLDDHPTTAHAPPTAEMRDAFNRLVGALDYPMFIVTTARGTQLAGCLVEFATQTSIEPPRFLVCVSRVNHTYAVARQAELLAVHVVPPDGESLAELFGGETGDRVDKFALCDWSPGPGGVPILADCRSWFVGRVEQRFDAGDHVGFLLSPIAATAESSGGFSSRRAVRIPPGHPV